MKRRNLLIHVLTAAVLSTVPALAAPPEYTIVDIGIADPGDFGSQCFGVSAGGVAVGRHLGVSNQAFSWTELGGGVDLPNLGSRPYAVGNGANESGAVVGTASTTFFGSDPLPVIWQAGVIAQLPLPAGETLGGANDINSTGLAVGSVDGGSAEQPAIYSGGTGTKITTTASDGSFMTTAFGVNDSNLAVGWGGDPNNAVRNVGLVYDIDADNMFEVGALPGRNGALCFAVSNAGHVAGSSMMNQGSGTPFIWTAADDISEVPLPAGTSQGSVRGVNSAGWVVGTASNAFAIPFLYDGTTTYAIADLLPAGSGWDLSMNTSSSALGISDGGIIVGTGVFNGDTRAYAMIPVVNDCPADLDRSGDVGFADLLQVLSAWGALAGCPEDLDESGDVGFADLLQVLSSWGPCA